MVNHFPCLASRDKLLLPYIQSSMDVWVAEEAKVWDSCQESRHCYVTPYLSVLNLGELWIQMEQTFVPADTEMATLCPAQMEKCTTIQLDVM